MVKYDKEEKRLIIPADINYYSLEEYKRGYQEGYEDGYASGITACTPDYSKEYLTIEALETGDFYVRKANIGYSVNEGEWETTTGVTTLALNQGDTVRFRGTDGGNSLFSGNTIAFDAYGNIMSLKYLDDFIDKTSGFTSSSIFYNCTGLVGAGNLILPATTLVDNCYSAMFKGCTSLTTAPELPATTLTGSYCYSNMFEGCTSLTTAPELPATTLAGYCYFSMFYRCTSLTTAPELPATTLVFYCYDQMFEGCTSLNYIKCLASDISAERSLSRWVRGVSPTGTFVTPSTTAWTTGRDGIPEGWTRVDI